MAQPSPQWITPEEYLRRERLSPTKNEYLDGVVFAMAGTSKDHSRIAINLGSILRNALRGTPYEAFESNIRVRVQETGLYTYPDLTIACEAEFDEDGLDTLLNPIIVVEILSPSTEEDDKGPKSAHYARLPSVREEWFVAQEQVWIERNRRIGPDQWLREWHREGEMTIEEPSLTVFLDDLYERVRLDPRPPLRYNRAMVQTAVLRTSAPQCLRQEAQAPERSERCDGEVDALSETNGRIKNPGVVFEVTSEGTRSFVQKEKLRLRFEEAPTDLG